MKNLCISLTSYCVSSVGIALLAIGMLLATTKLSFAQTVGLSCNGQDNCKTNCQINGQGNCTNLTGCSQATNPVQCGTCLCLKGKEGITCDCT